jgi:CRISPR-associated protein Cas2
VRSFTPSKGLVSILTITDKQYADIVNIWGAIEKKKPKTPLQLEIF